MDKKTMNFYEKALADVEKEIKQLKSKDWRETDFGHIDIDDDVSRRCLEIEIREAKRQTLLECQAEKKEFIKKLSEGLPMTTMMAGIKSKDYWKGVNDMINRAKELAGDLQ